PSRDERNGVAPTSQSLKLPTRDTSSAAGALNLTGTRSGAGSEGDFVDRRTRPAGVPGAAATALVFGSAAAGLALAFACMTGPFDKDAFVFFMRIGLLQSRTANASLGPE